MGALPGSVRRVILLPLLLLLHRLSPSSSSSAPSASEICAKVREAAVAHDVETAQARLAVIRRAVESDDPGAAACFGSIGTFAQSSATAGGHALDNNALDEALRQLKVAQALSPEDEWVIGNLIRAHLWRDEVKSAREMAAAAVKAGLWADPMQRPPEYLKGLPSAPFPDIHTTDIHGTGIAAFTRVLEEAYAASPEGFRAEAVRLIAGAASAGEGLQDPDVGAGGSNATTDTDAADAADTATAGGAIGGWSYATGER